MMEKHKGNKEMTRAWADTWAAAKGEQPSSRPRRPEKVAQPLQAALEQNPRELIRAPKGENGMPMTTAMQEKKAPAPKPLRLDGRTEKEVRRPSALTRHGFRLRSRPRWRRWARAPSRGET